MATGVEYFSDKARADFPSEWYGLAQESHFWMRWRTQVFLDLIGSVGIRRDESLSALDVGCGNGVVQCGVENATGWTVDGTDLSLSALEWKRDCRGRVMFYDLTDRRPEFEDHYGAVILFDVLEHIDQTKPFLDAVAYHLRPGGWLFLNVPALPSAHSQYDEVAGHLRRYTPGVMTEQLTAAGFEVVQHRWWGLSMIPLLYLRKLLIANTPSEEVIAKGFQAGGMLSAALSALSKIERFVMPCPPLGTSLMTAARIRK